MSKALSVFKHFSYYTIGSIIQGVSSLILLPVYTKYMSVEEYGTFSLLIATTTFLTSIFYFGANSSLTRFYFEKSLGLNASKVVTNSGVIMFMGISLFIIIGFLFNNILKEYYFNENEGEYIIAYAFASSIMGIINTYIYSLLRALKKSKKFLITNTISFFLTVITAIFLFNTSDLNPISIPFLSILTGFFIGNILIFDDLYNSFNFKDIDIDTIKKFLKFSTPVVFTGLIYYLIDLADRFIINELINESAVGIYSFGYKIGMMIHLIFIVPFGMIYHTMRMEHKDTEDEKNIVNLAFSIYVKTGVVVILIFLSFLIFGFSLFFDIEKYSSSLTIIPIILYSHFLYGMASILDHGIYRSNKTYNYIWINSIIVIINITLNIFLIERYGIIISAIITLFSYLFLIILIHFRSLKYYNPIIDFNKNLYILFTFLIPILIISTINYYVPKDKLSLIIMTTLLNVSLSSIFIHLLLKKSLIKNIHQLKNFI